MRPFFELLKKIIQTGVGKTRFLMAAVGLGIAMLLILIAIQAHSNFSQLLYSHKNQNETADFLVLNKTITNAMMGQSGKSMFSPEEIETIKKQPFVQAFGLVTSSQYKVVIQAPGELHFATDMFFEAVPDSFLDVKAEDWKWSNGDRTIPIILPNDFLNLYNFGFSLSQDLPQISQETVKALPLQVNISNNQVSEQYMGHIVGFSDRISSFLVPASFMAWANEKYGITAAPGTSRVIIKTPDPSNPDLVKFLADNGYTTNQDKLKFSKTRMIVQTIVSVVGFFGLILLFFALLVFSMFIQLVIASCKREIQLLVILGTAPRQLQRYLLRQFVPLYIIIGVLSLILVTGLQYWAATALAQHQMEVSTLPGVPVLAGIALVLGLVYIVNVLTVRKYVNNI
ncbi:FtsX-like permease family protein [Chitinophaga arvensicola]|uniref:FtsX-like permease family protein n=1 Tax=Chitinophaga arvensicola TaxID=29529 RepID=A0A1I0P5Q9_9BACT|nr:FtsX-like permease family protein [Chitinophaga arvensicola]SEW09665.1 FtsX-like permease family protein [Chitinophaga arvensicola]